MKAIKVLVSVLLICLAVTTLTVSDAYAWDNHDLGDCYRDVKCTDFKQAEVTEAQCFEQLYECGWIKYNPLRICDANPICE